MIVVLKQTIPAEPDLEQLTTKQKMWARYQYVRDTRVPLRRVVEYTKDNWQSIVSDLGKLPPGKRFKLIYEFARLFPCECPELTNLWLETFADMWSKENLSWWQIGLSEKTMTRIKKDAYRAICRGKANGIGFYGGGSNDYQELLMYMNAAKLQPRSLGYDRKKWRKLKRRAKNNEKRKIYGSAAMLAGGCPFRSLGAGNG